MPPPVRGSSRATSSSSLTTTCSDLRLTGPGLAVEDAEAQLQRFETLAARNTVSDVQLSDAALALSNARLDLREAEDALARRTVVAPFSGEVGLIDVGVGDYVTTATPVTTLDERETLLIEFRVPERFANQIAHGQPMTLSTPALPGLVLDGAISGMDSRIDMVSRTLTVQGTIANQDDLIRPGMSFEVSLSFAGNSYPSVPSLAVQWGSGRIVRVQGQWKHGREDSHLHCRAQGRPGACRR